MVTKKKKKASVYLLYFYVPKKYKEKVKNACFESGGGILGAYSHCCFEYQGRGQYLPLESSRPFQGKKMRLSRVKEVKVEMIVQASSLKKVLHSFLQSHPYEEPAYGFIKILS